MFLPFYTIFTFYNFTGPNLCDGCINVTQTIKESDLESTFETLETLCFGNMQCYNTLNNTFNYLNNTNSSQICKDIGFCSELSLIDYVTTSPNGKINLFMKNNNLLGYKVENNTNFDTVWNITFADNILDAKFEIRNMNPYIPNICDNIRYTILVVDTVDYIYFFNYTNDVPIYIGNITNYNYLNMNISLIHHDDLNKNESYLDYLYNSTHFNKVILIWSNLTNWNCYVDGYLNKCCDASISNIYLNSKKVSFY